MEYAYDTELVLLAGPFATGYASGRAKCADGKVRNVRFQGGIPDTFFSVPASVSVAGKTVSGYVTVETAEGWTTVTGNDPAVVKFIRYEYGKNARFLPAGAWKRASALTCPECGEAVWDGPLGHKLAKCWNAEGHESGAPLAFDTMSDEEYD